MNFSIFWRSLKMRIYICEVSSTLKKPRLWYQCILMPTNLTNKLIYFSPNIILMIKSRRMRWAKHVARVGEMRYAYRI
jgi:ABC-type arginine/histidine transport system permease subunit